MLDRLVDKLEDKREAAEARRDEVLRALDAEEISGPLAAIGFIAILKATAISAAFSIGTSLLTRALTPRQKFTTGQLQGTLQVPQSDQGLPIVEGYGADPGSNASPFLASHDYALEDRVVSEGYFYVVTTAGTSAATAPTFPQTKGSTVTSGTVTFTCYGRTGGGFRLPMLVVWTSGIRKHATKTTSSGGGKGPKPPEQTEITYDLDLAVMPGRGPLRVKRIRANTDTIYQTFRGESAFYQAESSGNTKTGGAANAVDALASGGSVVEIPLNGSLRWNGVFGDGTAVILEFYYKAASSISVQFEWTGANGTTTFNETLNASSSYTPVSYNSAPWLLIDSSANTVKVTNLSATHLFMDRLGVRVSGGPTGVPAVDIPGDEPYDPNEPHDPNEPYLVPLTRFSGELAEDVDGSRSGVVQAGSGAGISIYPGNQTQNPDPTVQAAVDAQYGSGSTPSYLGRCLVVLTNFFLTKYGGAIPLIQTLAEHQEIDTFEALCESLSDRTGVLDSSDYDYSGLRRLFLRGIPVTPPFAPADVMEELARVYNVYFKESDKIYGFERNSQTPVASLTSANLGWVEGDAEDDGQELAALDLQLATETEIARRYELTFVDPGRDFEQNNQGTSRQVTSSEKIEKTELAVTLYPEEAREFTQRELYEEAVESTKVSLSLDWSYLWLEPGDSFTVTEDDGTVVRVFSESIKPNVGVIPVEGFAEETAVYSQPVSTSGGVFEIPPVPIPGMTLVSFYDGPPLRTEDEGKAGFYAWAAKRSGDGDWSGAALYKMVEGEPQLVTLFDTQAVAGVAVTRLGPVSDFSTEDTSRPFTVNAGTDTLTLNNHGFQSYETIAVITFGTLPGGLSASTLYYPRDITANTFKLSLTPGGSVVDITSTGSGTHAVQRVIEVDLQDDGALLTSVTADQKDNGANPCLFGGEVLQVRTWELVAGYRRRFRGRDFTRGLRGSQPYADSHTAGERFLSIDSSVKFVAQDIGELDTLREYKAVTSGQSLDDAATVEYTWEGGTLKYPPPGVQASRDSVTNDWRFLIFGEETNDPEGELYSLDIVGGRSFNPRGGPSRPVSLASASAFSDAIPRPGRGSFRSTAVPGNSVTNGTVFVIQIIKSEPTAISATYETTLDETSGGTGGVSLIINPSGGAWGVNLDIAAQTSTGPGSLTITDNFTVGPVFEDLDGEATGTRYTMEFRDGKIFFYRNRHLHSNPFFIYTLPDGISPPTSLASAVEIGATASASCTLADIEIDDVGAAVIYYEAEQVEDFGTAQTSVTVRASQQRVVQGVVVDGQITEVTFP